MIQITAMANNSSSGETGHSVLSCSWLPVETWQLTVDSETIKTVALTRALVNSVTFPFTILFNLLVVIALVKVRPLRSRANLMLGCLAVTDLMTGLIAQPLAVNTNMTLYLNPLQCPSTATQAVSKIMAFSSLYHITLLNIDRLIAMKNTFRYPVIVTDGRVCLAVIMAWVVAIGFAIFDAFVPSSNISRNFGITCILTCLICCFVVWRESKKHRRQIAADHLSMGTEQPRSNANMAFALITVTHFLTYLFFFGIRIAEEQVPLLKAVSSAVVVFSSLINPLLYSIRTEAFRDAIKGILGIRSQVIVHG
ncbi:histamine H2 receptor-like isoform X2 [Nematostella vectensis]|uniref:histamine H2 receptor-like isoform X2 n=1 Tax=Nematostella vectensis TaxID=45351 RepID=UPI0020777686|nr:histamine H2 receptor-like isoform X2 [Nematostella vectensis]